MKICVVNNYPKEYTPARKTFLEKFFHSHQYDYFFVHYSDLNHSDCIKNVQTASGLILSGSPDHLSNPQSAKDRLVLIKYLQNTTQSVLGICFGHQLLGYCFGATVGPMRSRYSTSEANGIQIDLKFSQAFPLIEKTPRLVPVEVSHREEIIPTPEFWSHFENYASTEACLIHAIKHKRKPLFGVQFHPDTAISKLSTDLSTEATQLLDNYIQKYCSKTAQ